MNMKMTPSLATSTSPLRRAAAHALPPRTLALRSTPSLASLRCNALPSENATPAAEVSQAKPFEEATTNNAKFFLNQLPVLTAHLESAAPHIASAVPFIVLGCLVLSAGPADAAPQHQYDLSEELDLLSNVARYGRFFVTVMLGTVGVMAKPLVGLFKNPVTGVLAVVGIVGGVYGLKLLLELMLGITEAPEYIPGSLVGY
eukprot:gene11210-18832_t